MPLSTFVKLVGKALRYSLIRPLQRYNVVNRSKKYLGPEAPKFAPAPRAIGAMSQLSKPPQYPHIQASTGGFLSMRQRRLQAIERSGSLPAPDEREKPKELQDLLQQKPKPTYSQSENDDVLVREAAQALAVTKTVIDLKRLMIQDEDESSSSRPEPEVAPSETGNELVTTKRPLPTSTNLPLQDISVIWETTRVPRGRISLMQLQELLINKLADENYWTPERVSEQYGIKLDYAATILQYYKQIRIIMPPRVYKALEYTQHNDPVFQATKDLVYEVDVSMRNELDKKCDETFLPTDQLSEEIMTVLNRKPVLPGTVEEEKMLKEKDKPRTITHPGPLPVKALNEPTKRPAKEPSRRIIVAKSQRMLQAELKQLEASESKQEKEAQSSRAR